MYLNVHVGGYWIGAVAAHEELRQVELLSPTGVMRKSSGRVG